jgi:hypothetical protein
MTAQTHAERQRRYREARLAQGYIQVSVLLPPEAARIIERPALAHMSLADLIGRALTATWGNV